MGKKRKPHEVRTAGDYLNAADDALELAKILAGQAGISDQVRQTVEKGEEGRP